MFSTEIIIELDDLKESNLSNTSTRTSLGLVGSESSDRRTSIDPKINRKGQFDCPSIASSLHLFAVCLRVCACVRLIAIIYKLKLITTLTLRHSRRQEYLNARGFLLDDLESDESLAIKFKFRCWSRWELRGETVTGTSNRSKIIRRVNCSDL